MVVGDVEGTYHGETGVCIDWLWESQGWRMQKANCSTHFLRESINNGLPIASRAHCQAIDGECSHGVGEESMEDYTFLQAIALRQQVNLPLQSIGEWRLDLRSKEDTGGLPKDGITRAYLFPSFPLALSAGSTKHYSNYFYLQLYNCVKILAFLFFKFLNVSCKQHWFWIDSHIAWIQFFKIWF